MMDIIMYTTDVSVYNTYANTLHIILLALHTILLNCLHFKIFNRKLSPGHVI